MTPAALAIADTVLPPRLTVGGSVGLDALPVVGSTRWMTVLKNWFGLPRSYFTPSASRSVRFTRTIFALMLTCGWRRSSDSAKATRSPRRLTGAVMLTAFVTSSAVMLPRPWHWPSAEPPLGLVGPGFTPPASVG